MSEKDGRFSRFWWEWRFPFYVLCVVWAGAAAYIIWLIYQDL